MTESEPTAPAALSAEQRVVDSLYARLDELREDTTARLAQVRREGPSGSPQNRSERDAFATLYEDRLAQLDAVEDRLCFGRLDLVDGQRLYVGRIGLSDPDHVSLLTDWRAPAAQAFYSATAADPMGVAARRHLTTVGRRVSAIEDDVLDLGAIEELGIDAQLAGEGALLAALSKRRTDRMSDIVATIQAEQDAVIRAPLDGALVVQGGPGTGKTAVALHRAAYLLYHHRTRLARTGVLIVGPSPRFLQFIDHVLPSLGETGARTTTLQGLVPSVPVTSDDPPEVAALKGDAIMARVIARAVRERQRLPRTTITVRIDGHELAIRRRDIRDAQAKVRREHRPHNAGWEHFATEMISRLTAQYVEASGRSLPPEDVALVAQDIREHAVVRRTLNLAWMPLRPTTVVTDLLTKPHLLDHAASALTKDQRALLLRAPDAPFTTADLALLDEAAVLLGPFPTRERARSAEPSAEEVAYAKRVLETVGSGMVSAADLAARMSPGRSRTSIAEAAAADPLWTYGHVVVDEAQELSPMQWRMIMRRCPARSLTIVGDVAQASSPAGTRWWPETMDPLLGASWHLRELTTSYRIPAHVAHVAAAFAQDAGLPASPLRAARDVDDAVAVVVDPDPAHRGAAVATSHYERLAASGGGTVAVIVPEGWQERVDVDGPVVVSAAAAKGLEFDVTVVVEPMEIARNSADLYVALTRCTAHLTLVSEQPLPGWAHASTSA